MNYVRYLATTVAVCLPLQVISGQVSTTADLEPQFLHAAVDTISVTVEAPGRTIPFATSIESLQRVRRGARSAWEQVYQWHGNDGSRTADTLWFDAVTLQPLENHRHNGIHNAVTVFGHSSAHTRLTSHGGTEQVSDTTVAGPLYASGELAALIRAAPLAPNYAARYNLYYGPPRLVRSAPLRVVGAETMAARSGKMIDCWVVDAALTEGLNTFYISKVDHRVVRLVNHEDPTAAFVFTR